MFSSRYLTGLGSRRIWLLRMETSFALRRLKGHWSVKVNENWRLTFRFEGEDAILVDYQDTIRRLQGWRKCSIQPIRAACCANGSVRCRSQRRRLGCMFHGLRFRILNCKAGISAEMSLRLSDALGTSPTLWIHLQTQYDLWQASRNSADLKLSCLSGWPQLFLPTDALRPCPAPPQPNSFEQLIASQPSRCSRR